MNRTELAPYSPAEAQYYPRFTEIREVVTNRASERWTVERMARTANLGTNRFSLLYRRFFGTSPIDDLLSARIELAKYHLVSSDATLETIADACGFSNVYYFSRLFKKRVGCPPGEYRTTSAGTMRVTAPSSPHASH